MTNKHWQMIKIGEICQETRTRVGEQSLPVYSVTKHAGFVSNYFKKDVHSKDRTKYKMVEKGDFAYATIHLDEGSIGISPETAAISPMYTTFRLIAPEKVDPHYLFLFLKSKQAMAHYQLLGTGSVERRKNIKFNSLGKLKVPLPPLEEQRRIAQILSLADNLISKISLEIKYLNNDLFAALLPDLEASFKSTAVGDIAQVRTGATPRRSRPDYYDGGIPWVKTDAVAGTEITSTDESITERALSETTCRINRKGCSLIAMYGQGSTRGRAAILGIEAATNQACAVVEANDPEDDLFLFNMLKLNYQALRGQGRGGTQPNLNLSLVRNFEIPYPPKSLRNSLTQLFSAADSLSSQLEDRKKLLESLKSSLSARAFTGEL